MTKRLWFIGLTAVLAVLAVFCLTLEADPEDNAGGNDNTIPIRFVLRAGEHDETLQCWDEHEGDYVVFLPSCAKLEELSLIPDGRTEVLLDGLPITHAETCGAFSFDQRYPLIMGKDRSGSLRFARSDRLPAMFLHTASGTEETIHTQRNVWEYTEVTLVGPEGSLLYHGSLDEISGRGSGSWYYEKKSYNLKLNRPADLLGMGSGSRWVLLANVIDESHLRNKLVYDFARSIGSYDGFAPDSRYVDLFLNGNYVGLYLLTEKVEIAPQRVEADPETILFEVDAISRFERMNLPFILDWGIAAGIKSPVYSTEEDRDMLMNRLFLFQDTLQDASAGEDGLQYIDLDSWARRYLIDEVFENYDGGCHSQFFFWDPRTGHDNRIYAGPCWDYDNCADSWEEAIQNPRCFLMQRLWKNDSEHTPWYGTLMQKESFRSLVLELYRTELSPKLHTLIESGIADAAQEIRTASCLNALRWNLKDPEYATEHFRRFMEQRIAFLDSAWIEGKEYCTVTVKGAGDYRFYCTLPGTACADLPTPQELLLEDGIIWVREDSGEAFDTETVIREDITLVAARRETGDSTKPE